MKIKMMTIKLQLSCHIVFLYKINITVIPRKESCVMSLALTFKITHFDDHRLR